MMVKAMKEEITEAEEDKNKEQFDLDSELQNHQKTKKKELDELTIVATAMLMLIAGNLICRILFFLIITVNIDHTLFEQIFH
jgi:hypothetical protein